jgi:hypothetical protein
MPVFLFRREVLAGAAEMAPVSGRGEQQVDVTCRAETTLTPCAEGKTRTPSIQLKVHGGVLR